LAFGATTHWQELCDDDITSRLPDDITIDGDLMGCGQMVTSGLQVTSWAKTSYPGDCAQRTY